MGTAHGEEPKWQRGDRQKILINFHYSTRTSTSPSTLSTGCKPGWMSMKIKERNMLIGQQQPLAIAAKVLNPETMKDIRRWESRSTSYQAGLCYQGMNILDRWALNSPEKLKALESHGDIILFNRVIDQQCIEMKVLLSDWGLREQQTGLVPHEILAMAGVNMELEEAVLDRNYELPPASLAKTERLDMEEEAAM
jgi:hypothetical protein